MNSKKSNLLARKAVLLLAGTLTVMSGIAVSPSLPVMENYFSKDPNTVNLEILIRLIITLPALFVVVGSPIAGIIVDRLGRKPLLLAGVVFYGFAGVSGFVLNDLLNILIGRAFLGLSVACILVSSTTLIADYYTGTARSNFMGLQAAFMGLAGVVFLPLSGALASINWRYPFLVYLVSWLLIPLVIFSIYEPLRIKVKEEIKANKQVNSNLKIPIRLLLIIFGITTFTQIVFYLIPVQLPFYLRGLIDATPQQIGNAVACCNLFCVTAALFYGKLRNKLDFVSILPIIFGLLGTGCCIIGSANSYILVLFGLAIAGLGLGLLIPNMTVWISAVVPETIRGRAIGGLSTALFLGQFLSPIISQPVSLRFGLSFTYIYAGSLLLIIAIIFCVLRTLVFGQFKNIGWRSGIGK
ncbi:MAG: MFS transporter [Cyanobacteria bacterium J06636_27]